YATTTSHNLDDLRAHLAIRNGGGQTSVVLDDTTGSGAPVTYRVASSLSNMLVPRGAVSISTFFVNSLTLDGSPSDDTYNTDDALFTTSVAVATGSGHNSVNVAHASHNLAGIGGPLTVVGPADVVLDDSTGAGTTARAYRVGIAEGATRFS